MWDIQNNVTHINFKINCMVIFFSLKVLFSFHDNKFCITFLIEMHTHNIPSSLLYP